MAALNPEQREELQAALELAERSNHRGQGWKLAPQWGRFSYEKRAQLIDEVIDKGQNDAAES